VKHLDFESGDNVQILYSGDYRGRYKDCTGYIERNAGQSNLGVRLDNKTNKASQYGVFWFKKEALRKIKNNNEKEESTIMLNGYKVAVINFMDGKNTDQDYYYAVYDDTIESNDYVVVQTGHHGMAIAKVITIENDKLERVMCGREVIDKIDLKSFKERKEKLAKIQELKNKMDIKVKELQKSAIYEMLAEKDDTLKSLLTEYKSIVG
jgi:hypothetical protein